MNTFSLVFICCTFTIHFPSPPNVLLMLCLPARKVPEKQDLKCQWPQSSAPALCKHRELDGCDSAKGRDRRSYPLFSELHIWFWRLDRQRKSAILIVLFRYGRCRLGIHWAVRAAEAIDASTRRGAVFQYVLTNLSLRDTIRTRQQQDFMECWESRLTVRERQCRMKHQLCLKEKQPTLSSLQSPVSVCASYF